jgi:hypothetical protein
MFRGAHRGAELRDGSPRELPMPMIPGDDEDGPCRDGGVNRSLVRQHGDLDLALQDVHELVSAGMTLHGDWPEKRPTEIMPPLKGSPIQNDAWPSGVTKSGGSFMVERMS